MEETLLILQENQGDFLLELVAAVSRWMCSVRDRVRSGRFGPVRVGPPRMDEPDGWVQIARGPRLRGEMAQAPRQRQDKPQHSNKKEAYKRKHPAETAVILSTSVAAAEPFTGVSCCQRHCRRFAVGECDFGVG